MNVEPQPIPRDIVKLSGPIRGLHKTRAEASFVFTDADRAKMGVIAVSAAIAGLAGQAIAVASSDFEEDADYLRFSLDGKPVKGWVWRCPFREGDMVEVAAEWTGNHYEAYAIARPKDRVIGLYPHCSRGRRRHYANAFKWWLIAGGGGVVLTVLVGWMISDTAFIKDSLPDVWRYLVIASFSFFGLMIASLTHKWLPFARLAERCFKALEWPNPGGVDLVKRTKAARQPKDSPEMGVFYFRY